VLAVTIPGMTAEARISPAAQAQPDVIAGELVQATLARFARENPQATGARDLHVSIATTIPRSVGLGGSSAIVVALLRALCEDYAIELPPDAMAELALSIERDDLGITAGLQDRVTQTYEGVVFMDFAEQRYERLDPAGLPPLLIGWREHAATPSGQVHGGLMERWQAGDPVVHESIATLTSLGARAREALVNGDHDELRRCVDGSYDARARMLTLDPAHVQMIELARAAGAGANYTGSGGAVVCLCRDDDHRRLVSEQLTGIGCGTQAIYP
jgi:glucuronokinase